METFKIIQLILLAAIRVESRQLTVSPAEQKYIVALHNYYRSYVAAGQEGRGRNGPQPPAAVMMEMIWDGPLAKEAELVAKLCSKDHSLYNDKRFLIGQNIYWATTGSNLSTWDAALSWWYNEVRMFDPRVVDNFQVINKGTGHYTQLIWGETYLVGCGQESCEELTFYVCNYGPAGNVFTYPVYKPGNPCSSCPTGSFCANNLCKYTRDKQLQNNLILNGVQPLKKILKEIILHHWPIEAVFKRQLGVQYCLTGDTCIITPIQEIEPSLLLEDEHKIKGRIGYISLPDEPEIDEPCDESSCTKRKILTPRQFKNMYFGSRPENTNFRL